MSAAIAAVVPPVAIRRQAGAATTRLPSATRCTDCRPVESEPIIDRGTTVLAKLLSITSAVAAGAAAAALALAPAAPAAPAPDPNGCTVVGPATVCDPSIGPAIGGAGAGMATGAHSQNGSYGPSGDAPPVGGGGGRGLLGGLGGLL
jgi:hypothetical protein